MTRRDFLLASAAAAASVMLGCSRLPRFGRRRLNLILIVSDTLRADHLGCYGSTMSVSPVLDELAKRGTVFTNVMSCAPLTGAAHATLMTGAYQTRHGVVGNRGTIAEELPTLAEILAGAGYETGAFISNGVLKSSVLSGIERGFGLYNHDLPTVERNRPLSLFRIARDTAAAARGWLEQERDTPFFLWVHFIEPHGPYEVPEPALLKQVNNLPSYPGEPAALPVLEKNYQPHGIPAYQVLGSERDPRQYRLRYAARVRYMDAYVQQLLDALARLGMEDDTVIAFTSDHGELLGEHSHYFMHGVTLLQPVLSIPLIMAGPGIQPGLRLATPVSLADAMPTLLELLSVDSSGAAPQMQGRSLVSMLERNSDETHPVYALSKRRKEWSVRLGRHKYTMSERGTTGRDGLFDLDADPGEERDISRAHRDVAAELDDILREFMAEAPDILGRPAVKAPSLSKEDRQRLKALGYLD